MKSKKGEGSMDKQKVEKIVAEEVEKITSDTEIQLVDVEYVKEREWYLRVFIDKAGGVGLDDCQFVSRSLSDWLDEEDPIPYAYHLEVSSPGLDRPLKKDKDLERNIGNQIEATFFAPWEGQKKWVGRLVDFNLDVLQIEIEEKMIELPRKQIAQIRLYLD